MKAPIVVAVAALSLACTAVYPELKTPLRPLVGQQVIDPPPREVRWLSFLGAEVPPQTRDGRKWDALGGSKPDPYAILFLDGVEVLRTPAEANTLAPTWRGAPAGNFRIADGSRMRVELWDHNPMHDHPIGVKELSDPDEYLDDDGALLLETDSGAHVRVSFGAAHGFYGLGFVYELRTTEPFVTRVFGESPAAKAGLKRGDELVAVGGKPTKTMSASELQSVLNTPHKDGLAVAVRHADQSRVDLVLRDGAVYPLLTEQ